MRPPRRNRRSTNSEPSTSTASMAGENGEGATTATPKSASSSPLSSAPGQQASSPPKATKSLSPKDEQSSQRPSQDVPESASPNEAKRKPSRPRSQNQRVTVRRALKKSKWDAENILTDPKSPLASANLRSLLSNPMAWDALEPSDKAEIIALFPDTDHIVQADGEEARPDLASLMNDDAFRHDCATYTEHIAQGRFDPEWLACAWAAHEQRKVGDFDEHLINKFEDDWQVELPEDFKPRRQLLPNPERTADVGEKKPDETSEKSEEREQPQNQLQDVQATEQEPPQKEESPEEGDKMSVKEEECVQQEKEQPPRDGDDMVIDELQAEESPAKAPKTTPVIKRQGTRMDLDGTESEDELA